MKKCGVSKVKRHAALCFVRGKCDVVTPSRSCGSLRRSRNAVLRCPNPFGCSPRARTIGLPSREACRRVVVVGIGSGTFAD